MGVNLELYGHLESFALYACCTVHYDGRASSTLDRGNYLIMKKADGSILIHGAAHIPALNYMSSGSTIQVNGNIITATRRAEIIKIEVHEYFCHLNMVDWSNNKIKIKKTEAELTDKIAADPISYFGPGTYIIYREYSTPSGPVDLLLDSDNLFVVEIKRKKLTLKDCYQVRRYLDAFDKLTIAKEKRAKGHKVIGCLAGPDISLNALDYCNEYGFMHLSVQFDE